MALDVVTYVLCKNYTNAEIEKVISSLGQGMRFKGNVPTVEDLPTTADNGDMYLVDDKKCKAVRYNSNWLLFDFQITKTSQLTNDTGFINTTDDVIPGPAVLVNADTLDNRLPEYYSHVEVSNTGTATEEVQYIKINGVEHKLAGGGSGGSYVAGDGITITGNEIKVTPNKFMERKAESTPNRLMAFQDNTGLIKEIPVVWDSELGRLSTSEFNATTVGGGEGKITANKLSDGVTNRTINVSDIATADDMAGKQDKLTAGENITIDENNVISATGGGASVSFDNKTIIKGQGNKYQTAIGGWLEIGSLIFEGEGTSDGTVPSVVLSNSLLKAIASTDAIDLTVVSPAGTLEGRYGVAERSGTLFLELDGILERYTLSFEDGAIGKQVTLAKSDGNVATGDYSVVFKDLTEVYHPIDNRFLSLDNDTMALNSEGELTCISHSSDVEGNVPITGDEDELLSLKIGDKVYQNLNYHPFPDEFKKDYQYTLKEFGQSIVNYSGFATGCVWFGGIQNKDLPGNMMQCECKVTAIRDKTDFVRNIAIVEIFSSNMAPYYWHYNTDSWEEGTGIDDWKYSASIDGSKFDKSATESDTYNVKVKKGKWDGWEFYTEKDTAILDGNNVGVIVPFGGNSVPVGYLECNGAAVSRTTYSELFNIIGTTYGPGDGSTTFNLPNLQEKFVEGASSAKAVGTVINAGLPNITGTFSQGPKDGQVSTQGMEGLAAYDFSGAFTGGIAADPTAITDIDADYVRKQGPLYANMVEFSAADSNNIYGASTTVQPNAVVAKYIIKYTKTLGAVSEPDGTTIVYDANGKLKAVGGAGQAYTAGNGLQLANNEFSIDEQVTATKADLLNKQDKLTAGQNIDITEDSEGNHIISGAEQLPAYPTDTEAEYILALKYVDGAWVKYWKEISNKSDIVDKGTVDYMVIKS